MRIFFIVKNKSNQSIDQNKDSPNRFDPRAFDTEGIFFGEENFKDTDESSNQFNNQLNITKSWFERFITPSIRQNEQLRLNTTSNRKSNYISTKNETIGNASAIAGESLVTLDSKDSFARRILVEEDGTKKWFCTQQFNKV